LRLEIPALVTDGPRGAGAATGARLLATRGVLIPSFVLIDAPAANSV
jgi:hypothetical protein